MRRRTLRGGLLAIGATLSLTAGLAAPGLAAVDRPFPVVSVTGEAIVTAAPDLALVTAGVTSEAKTPREASEANARTMTAVLAAVRQAGIAEKDVRTFRYSIAPVHAQRRDAPPVLSGYRVSNQVEVKLRDISKVGDVLDQLVAAGATNIGGIDFTVSEPGKLLDQARQAAFADAKRKAELYAKAAGAQVGRAVSISEDGEATPVRPLPMRAAIAAAAPATPIAAGEETLRVQVSVSFELNQ